MTLKIEIKDAQGQIIAGQELTQFDLAVLENDLPGAQGIADWILEMVSGKVNSCAKRAAAQARVFVVTHQVPPASLQDFSDPALIAAMFAHPNYQNRAEKLENEF